MDLDLDVTKMRDNGLQALLDDPSASFYEIVGKPGVTFHRLLETPEGREWVKADHERRINRIYAGIPGARMEELNALFRTGTISDRHQLAQQLLEIGGLTEGESLVRTVEEGGQTIFRASYNPQSPVITKLCTDAYIDGRLFFNCQINAETLEPTVRATKNFVETIQAFVDYSMIRGAEVYHPDFNILSFSIRDGYGSVFGVDSKCQAIRSKLNDERHSAANLADYLSHTLQLKPQYVDTIVLQLQDVFTPSRPYDEQIRFVDMPSFNKVFRVRTKDAKKLIIKVHSDQKKAEIEQATNYYLSKAFNFIVPTDVKEPYTYGGLYLTVQDDVSDRATNTYGLAYRMAAMAKVHAHGKQIMGGSGLILPNYNIRPFPQLFDEIHLAGRFHPDISLSRIKRIGPRYEDGRQRLNAPKESVCLFGDPKLIDNTLGPFNEDLCS